tara:strand:- start:632 stop:1138 length:507 start_codon:yes stop_codon:yes gene_type:complete
MSNKFIYHRNHEDTMNESKILTEEFLRDGSKGLGFRYKSLDKKKNLYLKINGKLSDDGKMINLKIKEEGKEEVEKDIKVADLKKHKELKFVVEYMTKKMDKFRKTIVSVGGLKKRKISRKKTSRKKTSRKKTSRKKTSRKKTSKKKRVTKKKTTKKKSSRKRKSSRKK